MLYLFQIGPDYVLCNIKIQGIIKMYLPLKKYLVIFLGGFHILRKHIFWYFWPPLPPLISSFSTINKHILGNFRPPLPPQGAYVICERPLILKFI